MGRSQSDYLFQEAYAQASQYAQQAMLGMAMAGPSGRGSGKGTRAPWPPLAAGYPFGYGYPSPQDYAHLPRGQGYDGTAAQAVPGLQGLYNPVAATAATEGLAAPQPKAPADKTRTPHQGPPRPLLEEGTSALGTTSTLGSAGAGEDDAGCSQS